MKDCYPLYKNKTSKLFDKLNKNERDLLEKYTLFLKTTASENKAKQNIKMIVQFKDVVEKPLTNIKRDDLIGFWGLVKESEHEYNTKVMIKRAVKRFIKWYYKDLSLLEDLEVGDFKPNREKINKTVLLKPEEIKSILHNAQTLRDKALIILLYESASRPQELKDCRWKDLNLDREEIHLYSKKTERDRDIPIKESIIHLKRWKQEWSFGIPTDNDYIFTSRWRDKNLSTEQIIHIVKKIAERAGIKRNITPYTFRHSRLTEIYNLGIKGIEHNKFAGHKEGSKQQATYAHIDNEDMREEVLKKVYHIKEISPERKHELEMKIENQNKKIKEVISIVEKLESKYFDLINKNKKEIEELKKQT